MSKTHSLWRRLRAPLLGGLTIPVALTLSAAGQAQAPAALPPAVAPAPPAAGQPKPPERPAPLTLAECRSIGLQKQPALAAARASLSFSHARAAALQNLNVPHCLRPDLPVRRQQSAIAVQIDQARVFTAEWETAYAVTRNYLSVLYAREQLAVANGAVGGGKDEIGLGYLLDLAKGIAKESLRPDVKDWNVKQIEVYIQVAQGRREEAVVGVDRARAALREAMGVEPDCPVDAAGGRLPAPELALEREQVIALALSRRGELVQAALLAEVAALEVKAQDSLTRSRRANTFAAGSDLHAQPVPQGVRNGEYKPAAVGVEMPTMLAGSRNDRVAQAQALSGRAAAVAEKTRQLVALEAENAFLRWQEAAQKYREFDAAARAARETANRVRDRFALNAPKEVARPTWEELVTASVQATQTQLQANQARYQLCLAVAALERVTAGGVSASLEGVPAANGNNKAPNGEGR